MAGGGAPGKGGPTMSERGRIIDGIDNATEVCVCIFSFRV